MIATRRLSFLAPLLWALWPMAAWAHAEESEGTSFLGGFLHPLQGPDHLLAMLSVGIVSALIGGRAVFWVPAAFVACMVGGGVLGAMGVALPHLEQGIALSVLFLGAAVAIPRRMPLLLTLAVVGFFGVLHGNAHGVEMPRAAAPVFYSFGFIVSTSLIHVAGVGIGFLPLLRTQRHLPIKVTGLSIAMAGSYFLLNALGQ